MNPMLIPRSQASDAAADWAQKRKQALQRATELRAQRKAAEREASAAVRAPVRGLESDPLPKPPAGSAPDEAAAWWETNEGPAPVVEEVALKPPSAAEPVKAKAADKPRQRRQWGETVNVNNQSNQPNKERRGEHGDKKESSSRGNDSPPAEPGTPTGRLMPWEQELLIKRAEEEAHALGKEPPAPEVILARARGEDIPEPVAMSSNSPDPEVWGAPGRPAAAKPAVLAKKPAKEVQAKEKKGSMGSVVAAAEKTIAKHEAKAAEKDKMALKGKPKKDPYAAAAVPGFKKRMVEERAAKEKAEKAAKEAAAAEVAMKREAAAAEKRKAKATEPAPAPSPASIKLPVSEDIQKRLDEAQSPSPATTDEFHSAEDFPVHVVEPAPAEPEKRPPPTPTPDPAVAQMLAGFAEQAAVIRGDTVMEDAPAPVPAPVAEPAPPAPVVKPARTKLSEPPKKRPLSAKPKSSKGPPQEMVQKIVQKHVQAVTSPTPAASKQKKTPVAESPKASRGAQNDNPNPVKADHQPQKPVIGYDEFLRLQEQAAKAETETGSKPKPPAPFVAAANGKVTGAMIDAHDAFAAAKKQEAKIDKAPKKPSVAGGVPGQAENVVVTKDNKEEAKPEGKNTRQMFDKRESRRMNAKPFCAAVQRWRNRRAAGKCKPRRTSAKAKAGDGSISVYVRKRPLFQHEVDRGEFDVVTVPVPEGEVGTDPTEIVVHNCQMYPDLQRMFVKHSGFDMTRVFGEGVESVEVYQTAAAPMVSGALSGGIGALFMYGQTGSGKTFTMEAIEQSAVRALFAGAQGVAGASAVRVAYFEIAGKKCTDLLSPARTEISIKEIGGGVSGGKEFKELKPEEYRQLDVQLIGAMEPAAATVTELEQIIAAGKGRRATSATHCNAASSRSHAVLRLTCILADGSTGRLTLVDCAGSERKEDNMHHSAEQRRETAEINASLYALKECVRQRRLQAQKGSGDGHVHVPYRSSHLTRVLMECFIRPDAQLGVIGTVSPASTDTEHSVSTLKTVGLIGGREENEGTHEEKEDVSKNLETAADGTVTEKQIERIIAPVRWSNANIKAWIAKPGNEKFAAKVTVPGSLVGRDIVRMNPLALQNLCGGDAKLAQLLHNKLREEITRCSSRART